MEKSKKEEEKKIDFAWNSETGEREREIGGQIRSWHVRFIINP